MTYIAGLPYLSYLFIVKLNEIIWIFHYLPLYPFEVCISFIKKAQLDKSLQPPWWLKTQAQGALLVFLYKGMLMFVLSLTGNLLRRLSLYSIHGKYYLKNRSPCYYFSCFPIDFDAPIYQCHPQSKVCIVIYYNESLEEEFLSNVFIFILFFSHKQLGV